MKLSPSSAAALLRLDNLAENTQTRERGTDAQGRSAESTRLCSRLGGPGAQIHEDVAFVAGIPPAFL